ncbi:DUF2254 family protein [Streptomyces wuyuanensis]|uniref:DUF2254 family protein n=1 Tax=Streptomyces wuyuanensis TaxID=1196353 RepID=UPI003717B067
MREGLRAQLWPLPTLGVALAIVAGVGLPVLKALSPGIYDPTTAVHALSHSSALLCGLARRDLGPRLQRDEHEQIRVVSPGAANPPATRPSPPHSPGCVPPSTPKTSTPPSVSGSPYWLNTSTRP